MRTPSQIANWPRRLRLAWSYYRKPLQQMVRWLWTSAEDTNFTYHLTPLNLAYLASFLSVVADRPVQEIQSYLDELAQDEPLRAHIRERTLALGSGQAADAEARYARRVAWYALVRALRPVTVVESGVDKGLGTVVLAAALRRNAEAGSSGRVFGTDLRPDAGYLLDGIYAEYGTLLYGDSIASLQSLGRPIDLFINDSDHSLDYERREYQTILPWLHSRSVVVGDNAHVTTGLRDFALSTGRRFLYFHEQPAEHWYPGGGIGVAF